MSPEKKIKLNDSVEQSYELIDGESIYFQKETISMVYCSKYPQTLTSETTSAPIADKLLEIERNLASKITSLVFNDPVAFVYNPLHYAYGVHSTFVCKYYNSTKDIMFLGMNPGPWGMSQTGVPFGEVNIVRDWMGITGDVGQPERVNPKRPVLGFLCKRSEISGLRFWGLFKDLCGDPCNFFKNAVVYNHCPAAFMTESGRNITPSELKLAERNALNLICDEALYDVLLLLQTKIIIAIGKFAEKRAITLKKAYNMDNIKIECILHPSPRNFAIGNWKDIVTQKLIDLDLMKYFTEVPK